ncbi:MAG TPA: hypothetical protein VK988_16115 [Acidimicrobiales bacterium]|nr:hypothetical protein [Acidimicrobiales bacterium]
MAPRSGQGLDSEDVVQRVLTAVHGELFGAYTVDPETGEARSVPWWDGLSFLEARQEGSGQDWIGFSLRFTSPDHPGVLFGWEWSIPCTADDSEIDPEDEALYALRVLMEELDYGRLRRVEGLTPDENGVTWVSYG